MLAHYASLVFGSLAAVGAIGWASSIPAQPLAALVVMSTCIALWAGFDDSGRLPQSFVGGLSVAAILIVGLSIHSPTLPDWLVRGPWSTLGQAVSLTVFLLLNRRVPPNPLRPVAKSGRSPNTSRLSRRRTASLVGYAVAVAVVGYLVVLPVGEELVSRWTEPEHTSTIEDMTLAESIRLNAVRVFAAVWAFLIGACVGSFANVLVYRQPRGESVLMRPSACPSCNHRIEARDNIPVFGWLRLGGTCRNCTAEISPRYPIVEAVAGTIFVLLVFVELTSGGANFPVRHTNGYTGFVWTVFYPKWDLISLTLYHFHLLVMLLTWSLMRLDRVQLPFRSVIPALLIGIGGPLFWTKLWLVPPGFVGTDYYPQSLGVVAIALATAVAAALMLAALGTLLRIDSFRNLAPPLALIGATLGWQALLVTVAAAILIQLILKALRRPFISICWTLFATALIHQVCWRAVYNAVATVVE